MSCCVPGCKSNYPSQRASEGYVTSFRFPANPEQRNLWIRKIPRKDWELKDKSVVCIKHFQPEDILWEDHFPKAEGELFAMAHLV